MDRKQMKDYLVASIAAGHIEPLVTDEPVDGHAVVSIGYDDAGALIFPNSWGNEWDAEMYRFRFEGFAWKAATAGEFTPRSWKAAWKRERYFRQVYNKAARAWAGGKCKRRRAARVALATLERLSLQHGSAIRAVCVCPED